MASQTQDPNQDPNQDQTQTASGTDFAAWASGQGSSVGSAGGFGNLTAWPKRTVIGIDPSLSPETQQAISKQIKFFGTPGGKNVGAVYENEFLVNENRQIARAPYGPDDVYNELYSMQDGERLATLKLLQSRGFYGSGKPSATGTLGKDRNAFEEFLSFSNAKGYTWKTMVQQVIATGASWTGGGSGGSRYRVSASEDITEYLRKSSLEKLGRTMSKADIDKAIAAIQQQEATRGPSAPALSVMAGQQVSQLQGGAEKAVRFRKAIDAAMSIVG
jgi:hypothetical protein